MFAGLEMLQLLLQWPALLFPTANALCMLLNDLLSDAAQPGAVPAACRAALYAAAASSIKAFGLPAVRAMGHSAVQCAWREFQPGPGKDSSNTAALSTNPGKNKKRARQNGTAMLELDPAPPHVAAVQHEQRPAAIADTANAQVCAFCLWQAAGQRVLAGVEGSVPLMCMQWKNEYFSVDLERLCA